jgi:spore coat protein U-like protein
VFRCVKGTSYKTFISGTRAMTSSGNVLNFQLYIDQTHTTIFPSNNSGSSITAASNIPITQNIYGSIDPQQDVAPASYNTTLVATVEY